MKTNVNETKILVPRHILLNGTAFHFSNEQYQNSIGSDDIREAKVYYRQDKYASWINGYKLWFNGSLIWTCKNYIPMIKRLNELINTWHLIHTHQSEQFDSEL